MEKKLEESIQLVNYNTQEKTYTFNKEALQRIIEENEVQDLPVTVISVAGLFRKGKSFLLNYFLRYLHAEDRKNWLNGPNESLEGFDWRGGSTRNTEGIHMWSKIFKLPTADGNQAAVILMDTQGTFDGTSSNKTGTIIFALSALVSSIQIYNLSSQINENDLENLLLCTAYASFVQKETEHKPFQTLLFLVRDWQFYQEFPYGEEGGKQNLDKILKITADQEPSLTKVRNDIRSTFEKVSCFLLPHPGLKVATNMDFNGCMKDIDADFITHMRDFIPSVLSPNNLVVKNIGGLELKGREFVELFATYLKHYNTDELPDEMSKAEAAAEAYYAPLLERCFSTYKTEMMKMLHDYQDRIEDCTTDVFREAHERIQTMVDSDFNKTKCFEKDIASKNSKVLTARIQELFDSYNEKRIETYKSSAAKHYNALANRVVKEYNMTMVAILAKSEDELEHYTPTAYADTHEEYKRMSIGKFDEGTQFVEYDATKWMKKMEHDIEDSFEINEDRRKAKFESAANTYYNRLLETCLDEYNTKMGQLMDTNQLVMNSLAPLHETNKSDAMNQFKEAKCYSKDIQSKYSSKLQARIETAYVQYQKQSNYRMKYDEEKLKLENDAKQSAQEREYKLKELKAKHEADERMVKENLKAEDMKWKREFESHQQANEAKYKLLQIEMENKRTEREADRKAVAEKDERDRIAEAEKDERDRIAAAEKNECDRIAAAEQGERDRKAEAEKGEREKELKLLEIENLDSERKAAAEKDERDRKAEAEKYEGDHKAAAEKLKLEQETEIKRLENENLESDRKAVAEKGEREKEIKRLENENLESARKAAAEKDERDRKAEAEKYEGDRKTAAEKDEHEKELKRLENENLDKDRKAEAEKGEREKEIKRLENENLDKDRKAEAEKNERDRIAAAEKGELDRIAAAEKGEREKEIKRLENENLDRDRKAAVEKDERDRKAAAEKGEHEKELKRLDLENLDRDRIAAAAKEDLDRMAVAEKLKLENAGKRLEIEGEAEKLKLENEGKRLKIEADQKKKEADLNKFERNSKRWWWQDKEE